MGGLAIICGNEVKCRPDGIRGKAFFEGKGPSENVILALFKENSRLKRHSPRREPCQVRFEVGGQRNSWRKAIARE